MQENIIKIQSLNVWYNGFHALKGITMDIPKNAITALIGASGSGKSTLLRSLNRILDVTPTARFEGSIMIGQENILKDTTDVIALRRRVGMVFQNPTPFPKSIFDNVAYGLQVQGVPNKRSSLVNFFKKNTIDFAEVQASQDPMDIAVVKSLQEAGLWDEVKDRLWHSAFRLSGGQQQRLCIARAIAIRPEILLLDEPCSDLDPISTRKIEELLIELKKHYTIVIVTHNMHQAKRISDYVAFLHTGEFVESGTTKDIFENPQKPLTRDYVRGVFG